MSLMETYNHETGLLVKKIEDLKNDESGTIDDKLARITQIGELNSVLKLSESLLSKIDESAQGAVERIETGEQDRETWSEDRKKRFDDRKLKTLQSYFEAEVTGAHIVTKGISGRDGVINSAIELAACKWEKVTGFKPEITKFKLP